MNVEILDRRVLSETDARSVAELICTVWPKPGRTVELYAELMLSEWHDYRGPKETFPRFFILREGGRVIACAGADPRTIGTSQGEMMILALKRVCTAPAARGRGLGQAVVEVVFDMVNNDTYPFALFQTKESVRPFYEKLGAVVAQNRIVNSLGDDPAANPFWEPVVMRFPAGPGWPAGEIDLRGRGY
jgi:GNAT superfamily N-acetyltransferase